MPDPGTRALRIVKDRGGPYLGGAVLDADTGDRVKGVTKVELVLGVRELPTATVTLLSPEVDVTLLAEIELDLDRLATVLWKKALEARGVGWDSDPVLRFDGLPESEQKLWRALAQASFDFVHSFNSR